MKRASLPIRMRGSFLSMPLMMRSAASRGVVLAAFSNRSIDCDRRALSVTPTPVRELRAMAVATPPGCTTGQPDRAARHGQLVPHALGKAAHREFRRGIGRLSRRGDDAEDRGQIDDVRLWPRPQMRQEGARA